MTDTIAWLKGKKTYLLAFVAIITAAVSWFIGDLDAKTALEAIWAALMGVSIRAGVSNEIQRVK